MRYKIKILSTADKKIRSFHKAGNKKALNKIQTIIQELQEHPTTGTGHPEQLKHELLGYWSRRIDKKTDLISLVINDLSFIKLCETL